MPRAKIVCQSKVGGFAVLTAPLGDGVGVPLVVRVLRVLEPEVMVVPKTAAVGVIITVDTAELVMTFKLAVDAP